VLNINFYTIFMRSSFKFMLRRENVVSINVAQNRDDLAIVNTINKFDVILAVHLR